MKLSAISRIHYGKMALRGVIFLAAAVAYLLDRLQIGTDAAGWNHGVLIAAWLLLMIEMVLRLFPSRTESMGCQRQFAKNYKPTGYPPMKAKNQTKAVIGVVAAWFALNGAIGVLYFTRVIDAGILVLVSLAYSVCDMICILLFCPFQVWFLKNKCCTTCRIYNWDFAMMCTPLIFIRSNYTGSLVLMSLAILAKWEITFRLHPERFSTQTNESLSCAMCEEKLCQHKTQLKSLWKKYGRHGG